MHVTFSIDDSNGDVSFLVNDASASFLDESSVIRRASHVLPRNAMLRGLFKAIRAMVRDNSPVAAWTRLWTCKWIVDLSPVNGPILPELYSNRFDAIAAEVEWLERNFL
jgi:hypothetical protein